MLKRLNAWMFGWGSPVTMATVRILVGALALFDLLLVAAGFEDWLTEKGYVPLGINEMYFGDMWRINVFAHVTDARVTLALYVVITIAAFTTMIGFWTRISSIILAIGLISLHHRNGLILHGGDTILRQLAILTALAPSGAAVSLDRWLAIRKGKAEKQPMDVSLWPQRVMMLQVSIVYYTTLWHKWGGTFWKDGTAIYYPLNLNEFEKFWLPDFIYSPAFIFIFTYGTLATQFSLATLAYIKPFRKYVLIAGCGMHLFIEYAMNVPLFSFLMMTSYVSFYEGHEIQDFWDGLKMRFARKRRLPDEPGTPQHV